MSGRTTFAGMAVQGAACIVDQPLPLPVALARDGAVPLAVVAHPGHWHWHGSASCSPQNVTVRDAGVSRVAHALAIQVALRCSFSGRAQRGDESIQVAPATAS